MSAGDDAPTACQREAEEELGLKFEQNELIHVFQTTQSFVLHNGKYKDNEFVEVYIVMRDVDIDTVVLQESEVEAVRWMDWREVRTGSLDPVAYHFVPVHTHYEPFWNFLEAKFPQ
jgi:8-oxo-dGTP diphosphatase